MNIGILTYHWVANFGANLQALSTYCYLKKDGHNPIIIDWVPEDLEKYYDKVVPEEQREAHYKFAKLNFASITKRCRTSIDVANAIVENNIHMVVIGSDAVFTYIPNLCRLRLSKRKGFVCFKPCVDSDFPNPFWGDFLNYLKSDIKVCVMSASAQNTNYKFILNKKPFEKALSRFSYISVRDVWTQNMVSYLTNKKIIPKITPDPVFGFEPNVVPEITKDFIINKFNLNENYVLVSITDKDITSKWLYKLADEFEKRGINLVSLDQTNKQLSAKLSNHVGFPLDPLEWYSLIKYSSGYIGELMHPILVSLHNSIPVYVFDLYGFNKGGHLNPLSSKTYQILSKFELLNCYYNKKLNQPIPSPDHVVATIMNFDKIRCRKQSLVMYDEYCNMMKNITSR